MDPYQELGVRRDATPEQVKHAYRKRVQKAHPDKGGTKEKFHAIQKSYDILSDAERRKRYDQTGDDTAPAADPRELAMAELASIFLTLVDSQDADHSNLIEMVKQPVEHGIAERKGRIVQLKNAIEKRERALKRVSRKTAGNNVFARFLAADIASRHQAIAKLEVECERGQMMLGMLAEYEYKADVMTPNQMFAQFQGIVGIRTYG